MIWGVFGVELGCFWVLLWFLNCGIGVFGGFWALLFLSVMVLGFAGFGVSGFGELSFGLLVDCRFV